eukprot:Nk52_evm13s2402 gene=Nk52_evmTU13s2402
MYRTNSFCGQIAVAMMAALLVLCVALTQANPMVETHAETNHALGSRNDAQEYCTALGGKFLDSIPSGNSFYCKDVKSSITEAQCVTFCSTYSISSKLPPGKCPAKNSSGKWWITTTAGLETFTRLAPSQPQPPAPRGGTPGPPSTIEFPKHGYFIGSVKG